MVAPGSRVDLQFDLYVVAIDKREMQVIRSWCSVVALSIASCDSGELSFLASRLSDGVLEGLPFGSVLAAGDGDGHVLILVVGPESPPIPACCRCQGFR